jgi:hypothetical protein
MLFHEFVDENKTQICVYEAGPNFKVVAWIHDVTEISEDRYSVELDGNTVYELFTYNAGFLVSN